MPCFYSVWILTSSSQQLTPDSASALEMQKTTVHSTLPIKSNGGLSSSCSQLQHLNLVGFVNQFGITQIGTLGSENVWIIVNRTV